MSEIFVGIDISKLSFDVAIVNQDCAVLEQSHQELDSIGCENLLKVLNRFSKPDVRIAMESTGIYHFTLLNFLLDKGFRCFVINPVLINSYVKSQTLRKSKTNKIDCSNIAKYLRSYESKLTSFKPESIATLKPLSRIRETTAMDIAKTKTEIKRILSIIFPELEVVVNVFTKSMLLFLKKRIQVIRESDFLKQEPLLKKSESPVPTNLTLMLR